MHDVISSLSFSEHFLYCRSRVSDRIYNSAKNNGSRVSIKNLNDASYDDDYH